MANSGIKILVIDDLQDNLITLNALMKDAFPEAITLNALNGEKGLELAAKEDPDVILLDIIMPGMDGYEVCQKLKTDKELCDIPVVFVTAIENNKEALVKALESGGEAFLTKPIDEIELTAQIRSMLKIREANNAKKDEKVRLEKLVKKRNKELVQELEARKQAEEKLKESEATVRKKLKAILEPKGDVYSLELSDIIDVEVLQSIMDDFYRLTGMLGAVLDVSGKVLVAVGWQDICTKFHRCHPVPLKNCLESDTVLTNGVAEGEFKSYRCKNNLWDIVTPIMIGGKHLGNVFMGQYFLEDEEPDIELFRKQAKKYGFDEAAYLAALDRVPRFNKETLEKGMQFYSKLAKIISTLSYSSIQQSRMLAQQKQSEHELIEAKAKAEESDHLKTAFLHNVSHEIRTPLNAIVGFSGILNNPDLSAEKSKHFTNIIRQSSGQLLSIVDDIIRIASIESGQEIIQEDEINIHLICNLIKEQFFPKNSNKNITLNLKTNLPDDEAIIITDSTKLIQILTNLIGNALKFTQQGYVNFGYTVKESQLEFYVEDSGIGIPLDMQDAIFNRFRQVETTAKREFGGSGLGLSISKAYVEMLGGKIWLTSELNKGSVFYFTIPYKKLYPKGSPDIPSIKELGFDFKTPKTLLIAEDEDSNFMLLEELLSDMGINIIRAVDGLEAVELCKSNPQIDLVLMDIKMPVMDGYKATAQIKEFKPDLYIIAQTAYSTESDKDKAFACGCSDFMSKPLNSELLVSKIKEQLLK